MSKEKTYNSLEAFAKEWKQENPVKSVKSVKSSKVPKSKKVVDTKETKIDPFIISGDNSDNSDDGTFIIRIPM